jgi:hypothetical protein
MTYLDFCKLEAKVTLSLVQMAILFVQMVRGNMEGYTQCEVEEAALPVKPRPCLVIQLIETSWGWYIPE